MNPVRLDYLTRQIAAEFDRDLSSPNPFSGLRILDIGCGGGLVTEPLARLGATVVGIDAAGGSISIATLHAEQQGLNIDYRNATAEVLAEAGEDFDAVLALEIIEHVPDPGGLISAAHRLVRPGGLVICSTLNRTAKSYALAIVGAEFVLGWLPKGTHDWSKFIRPEDLGDMLADAGLELVDLKGFIYNPIADAWRVSPDDLSVNYVATALRSH